MYALLSIYYYITNHQNCKGFFIVIVYILQKYQIAQKICPTIYTCILQDRYYAFILKKVVSYDIL